jgi:anti-sigma regulatory factor (Ser/Thr protein kinase)
VSGEAPGTPAAPVVSGRWSDTPLGPRHRWDPALRAVVDLILASPAAMALGYGDDPALIYNDGFAALIGPSHPAAFGRPAAEAFGEVWQLPGVGDVIEQVYRTALRALALTDADPAAVLHGLDRLVASLGTEAHSDELFVTVVYGIIDPERGRLRLASAGHPAPVLRRSADGRPTARYVELSPGVPLGLGGRRSTSTTEFRPGDTLLLFSDGVVERRQQDLSAELDRLAGAAAEAASGDPRTLCAAATAAVPGATEDDVAVLAVEHAVTPSRSARMKMPAEASAPGRVRHWLAGQLTGWQLPEQVINAAVLCTSELTTNALLHAGTAARVEIDVSPERLLVSVSDSGTRGTVTRARPDALSSRGRGLDLIERLSDSWGTDPTVRGSTVWFEIPIRDGDTTLAVDRE